MYRRPGEELLSDAEVYRRRKTEWREEAERNPINLANLRADVERIAQEIRQRKTDNANRESATVTVAARKPRVCK